LLHEARLVKDACIQAVQAAIGRGMGATEAAKIEEGIGLQMRLLARKDADAWRSLSQTERLTKAAEAAAQDMVAQAQKKQQRLLLAIAAHDRIENFMADQATAKPGDKLRALSNVLDFNTKGSGFSSAGSWAKAIQEETFAKLIDTWSASHPKFFGLFENREGTRDLIREMFGEKTGNAAAAAGAKAWLKTMDELRDRYNAAGGDVGKLDEWHFPQHHSQMRVAQAGLEKWLNDLMPLLDRGKYLHEDGRQMSDSDVRQIMTGAYDSITTDGQNKVDTSRPAGYGLQANRGSEHRIVLFKDSASYLAYQGLYGEKSLWNVLTSHVRNTARDVGVSEVLGPDPDRVFASFNQRTYLEELRANATEKNKLDKIKNYNDRLLDYTSGRQQVVDTTLAARFQAFRNFMTAVKLPKVIITALSDESGMMATSFANKIPYSAAFLREMQTLNPVDHTSRSIMERNGVGLNSMMGALSRFGQEEYGSGWTGKLANLIMHASGAERMWDARRQGLASVLMQYVAKVTREHEKFSDLNKADHGVLTDKGVTEADWAVWQKAEPEMWGSNPMITPKAVQAIPDEAIAHLGDPQALRRHASTQLLAHVLEEAGMGAMDTGARQRVVMQAGTTKGTWGGELLRSVMLFKSYAASMMMKHWGRAASMPGAGSKFAYFAPLIIYGAALAALGNQLRNVLSGKDPENMASPKFWGAAVLRGGGLGFYGDFLYDEFNSNDNSLAAAAGGPLATTAEDVWKLTGAAAIHHAKGERTDEGAGLIRFAKQNVPILNLWYLQAAMDHILWNSAQEAASPGYLERMQAKAEGNKGTTWYWQPQERAPARAPDISTAHLFDVDRGKREAERVAQTISIQ
jgi:hypothetical protein